MKKQLTRLVAAGLLAAAAAPAGTFYGLWWDGANEHFGTLDPYTGAKTSVATVPGVNYIALANYAFDPDSSRYAFVGGASTGTMEYIVLDAPTGGVVARTPRTDKLIEMDYSPRRRTVYGLQWADSSITRTDSLGRPLPSILKGTEYFVRLDPFTGAKDSTAIPGVKLIRVNSHVLAADSGLYAFAGSDTAGVMSYYVLDVETGAVVAKIPHTIKIDNPVYDAARGVVHGLWWSDSSTSVSDSGIGIGPKKLRGTEYFVTLHPDSTITRSPVPGVLYITYNRALDTDSGRYVFAGRDTANHDWYYVIDVETGAVLSQAPVTQNISNIAFAPSSSTVYPFSGPTALTAGREAKGGSWSLHAPRGGIAELKFENPNGAAHAFSLLDLSGRTALSLTGIRSGAVRFDVSNLKPGVYLFRLRAENGAKAVAVGKLRVE